MRLYNHFKLLSVLLFVLFITGLAFAATTGKIVGQVSDESTGGPLMGANVILAGTNMGAAAAADGYYIINNIPPGVYTARITMIGYATNVVENVQVSINQTTTIDVAIATEAIAGQEVVVRATRPVVQLDISSSRRIVTAENIRDRPLDNMEEILAAEVGISLSAGSGGSGVIIRGSNLNETDIVIDGLSTRNERNQQPMTNLNLTAIEEIEILTGGFSAEYGDIRAGMISVVTREGSPVRYSFDVDLRMSPPAMKHFGPSPFSVEGPFWQVYTGEDAFTGIDQEMVDREEDPYPFTFVGWNEVARQFVADPDPDNDMTPQELLEVWKWQHRNRIYADKPDNIADITISGPLPFIPVTFLLSHRYENLQLAYPYSRNNSLANSTIFKLTSQITPKIKITLNNTFMSSTGISGSIYNDTNGMITGSRQGTNFAQNTMYEHYIWNDACYSPISTKQYRGGLRLNHMLSSSTFYNVTLEYKNHTTFQEPIGLRDTTGIKKIGNNWYDEAPFGYVGTTVNPETGEVEGSVSETYDILGDFFMSGGGRGQDHSKYWGMALGFDLVSQINRHNEIKMGLDLDYNYFQERREINHGYTTRPRSESPGNWWYYNAAPIKAGAYIQDKLEHEGMIANIGVRVDALYPNEDPYNLDPDFIFENLPYGTQAWRDESEPGMADTDSGSYAHLQLTGESGTKVYVSPRLGISHPVTATSKIFFNYGFNYQPPVTDRLFLVQPSGSGGTIPNLQAEWPLTVSYEVGYEMSLANQVLIHIMGYYKNASNQLTSQNIVSFDGDNNISTRANNSYADTRGLELKLEKRVGRWWYGWVTFEYMVRSSGRTGLRYVYENRQLARQQREETNQSRGWPRPSMKAYLTFKIPPDYGFLLGDWRLNVLTSWSDGGKSLLNPQALLSDQNYVDRIDYYSTDLLLEKQIWLGGRSIAAFMQVKNAFNYRGSVNPRNYTKYIDSLKFPHEEGDQKGNDKIGEWDKDHIEIGYNTWTHHVNPRDIFFGIRVQF